MIRTREEINLLNSLFDDAIEKINEAINKVEAVHFFFTRNYENLSWEERSPDAIKNILRAYEGLMTAKIELIDAMLNEHAIRKEEYLNGKITSE